MDGHLNLNPFGKHIDIPSRRSGPSSSIDNLVVALIVITAVGLRLLPWSHVFSQGKIYLYDPDCYMRLRKIFIYLNSFPSPFVYDYFQGFPQGTGAITPPPLEYLVAALAYPLKNFAWFDEALHIFVAVVPPLIGGSTVLLLFNTVNTLFGRRPAFIASMVLAVVPYHVDATVLGRFDNEMLEPLFLLAVFRSYVRTYDVEKGTVPWVEVGALSTAYLTVWRGAILPLSLIGIDITARLLLRSKEELISSQLGQTSSRMYLISAALLTLICGSDVWGTRHLFSYNIISWFHVTLFGVAALFLLLVDDVMRYSLLRDKIRTGRIVIVASIVTGIAFLLIKYAIIEGLYVVGGGNYWLDSISQYQRLFSSPRSLVFYSGLLFLSPLSLFLLRSHMFESLKYKRFLVLWTLFTLAATLVRQRYGLYYALAVAITTGIIVYFIEIKFIGKRFLSGQRVLIAGAAVLIALQLPTLSFFSNLFHSGGTYNIKGDIEDTMVWLRDHTPPAGDPYRPSRKPTYGVLARWDFGGWIESIALRPSLATNYGTETYGMDEVARFFLAASESEATAVLKKNSIRYVIIDKVIGDLPMYAGLLNASNHYFVEQWDQQKQKTVLLPTKEVFSLVSSRLFFTDGSLVEANNIRFAPLEGFRLLHESSSPASVFGFPWEIKRLKIFEFTDGASVSVKAPPGCKVILSQLIETNQGRRFEYRNEKVLGHEGTALFKILYPMKTTPLETGALKPAVISCKGENKEFAITESAIQDTRIFTHVFSQ